MEEKSLMKISLAFDRMNRIYFPNDIVYLTIHVVSDIPSKINSFRLHTEGKIQIKHLDKLEKLKKSEKWDKKNKAFFSKGKILMNYDDNICTTEEINIGSNLFLSSFKIEQLSQIPLLESFSGYYLEIIYFVEIEMRIPGNPISNNKEPQFIMCTEIFYVNIPGFNLLKNMDLPKNLRSFIISDKKIKDKKMLKSNLNFHFEGEIENSNCDIDSPLKGFLSALNYNEPIQSIELVLVRLEGLNLNLNLNQNDNKDKNPPLESEMLNIQIADGDIPIGVKIPIFLVLPRQYSSLFFTLDDFSVNFALHINVIFVSGFLVTEVIEIFLYRKHKNQLKTKFEFNE